MYNLLLNTSTFTQKNTTDDLLISKKCIDSLANKTINNY